MKLLIRANILRAISIARTIIDSPGRVRIMSAAARAASVPVTKDQT